MLTKLLCNLYINLREISHLKMYNMRSLELIAIRILIQNNNLGIREASTILDSTEKN